MSARQHLIAALAKSRGRVPAVADVDHAERLVDAHRAEVLAERDAMTVAWLVKKAREFRAMGGQKHAAQADAVAAMASKIERGAVRPNNLRTLTVDFFEPGRTYTARRHADLRFECLALSADPDTGECQAIGWRYGPPHDGVRPHKLAALGSEDFACCNWAETTTRKDERP